MCIQNFNDIMTPILSQDIDPLFKSHMIYNGLNRLPIAKDFICLNRNIADESITAIRKKIKLAEKEISVLAFPIERAKRFRRFEKNMGRDISSI